MALSHRVFGAAGRTAEEFSSTFTVKSGSESSKKHYWANPHRFHLRLSVIKPELCQLQALVAMETTKNKL